MTERVLPYIYDVERIEIEDFCSRSGYPPYRSRQVLEWLDKGIRESDEMTNLPRKLRESLAAAYSFSALQELLVEEAKDQSKKYVLRLHDGNVVESVSMEYRHGRSVCLSTQAGCRMGCQFCASAAAGFGRNLTAGEMLAQLFHMAACEPERIRNIVLMGIGEPFENYEAVLRFLRMAHEPSGLNISFRHMSVSTCGLVPEMIRFTDENLPITLAVSLHAARDGLRKQLMPIARRYALAELMSACRYYTDKSGRRITFEYALFKAVNDSREDAEDLARLLSGQLCHVNLIPANPFEGSPYQKSSPETVRQFQDVLQNRRIPCTLRRALGKEISAACGQLRRRLET